MDCFYKIFRQTVTGGMWIAGVGVAAMAIVLVANIIFRFFGGVIGSVYELTEVLSGVIVAFAFSFTTLMKAHISVNLVLARFNERTQLIVQSFSSLLSIIFLAFMIWASVGLIQERWTHGELTTIAEIPVLPFRCIFALGLLLFLIAIVTDILLIHSKRRKK